METSRRVFTRWGDESLHALLAAPGAVVWYEGPALHGALLVAAPRGVVAEARLLAVHDDADPAQCVAETLPLVERRLARRGVRWVSFSAPETWLRGLLLAHGYALKDRVITYARRGLNLEVGGNPDVAVVEAQPADVPGMVAVDRAAFEPFWRFDATSLGRALEAGAYALVARWGAAPHPGGGVGAPPPAPLSEGEERGDVIGYLTAEAWAGRAHIVRLAVVPERQRRGVGTRLIAELFRRLRGDAAVREVTLNTQETNVRSRRLYEGLGFRPTGRVEDVWARELDPPADGD
ncbi:MAG TPA: GNAT family N-acetyltransferase [Chloroflexi bacterium]|jgi:ribosomal protein S18 acetylase RimI-like enzyme|nr:GNAT family N-acetyltransferase [Chloroflexota bacterium]